MLAKQFIFALFAFQVIAAVTAQAPATGSYAYAIDARNVSTDADDYLQENRRLYNATLKSYLDQIDSLRNTLESELKVIEKQNGRLLDTIQEAYEQIEPLEALSLFSKYCVQRYRAELPYADTIKANLETCVTSTRNYITTIVASPTSYYTTLNNYYNADFKTGLTTCGRSNVNPSLNYTLCIQRLITTVNTVTNNHRDTFATSMQASECSLNSRMDVAVSCTYAYYNSALASIGAVTRLINDCVTGYVENRLPCVSDNSTVAVACPNVLTLSVTDADFQNATIANPLLGFVKTQSCLELRFV